MNLAMAKTMAAEAGAEEAANLIDQLKTYTDEAVQTLRELAHGIYPATAGLPRSRGRTHRKVPFRAHLILIQRWSAFRDRL